MNAEAPKPTKKSRMMHFFLMPTLKCQAGCLYCFQTSQSKQVMTPEIMNSVSAWFRKVANSMVLDGERPYIKVTFHGGEPLLMGADLLRTLLENLFGADITSKEKLSFSMQSNLWNLNQDYCDIIKEYKIGLGTSLDGPEHVTDAQRGAGYFKKTMKGVALLRKNEIPVECICTFTRKSAPHVEDIYEFFAGEKINFTFFAVQPALDTENDARWCLSGKEQCDLVEKLLKLYLSKPGRIRVNALNALCGIFITRKAGGFIQANCLERQYVVGPDGSIYHCPMAAGNEKVVLANVSSVPSIEELHQTPVWFNLQKWLDGVQEECSGCSYVDICKGGCSNNACIGNGGNFSEIKKDVNCDAYKRTLDHVLGLYTQAMQLTEDDLARADQDPRIMELKSFSQLIRIMNKAWNSGSLAN